MSLPQSYPAPASAVITPVYSFLSQPPPQKKRPSQPLPAPPAFSNTHCSRSDESHFSSSISTSITAWIADVQPGPPAPLSPTRRASLSGSRRSSVSRTLPRRASVSAATYDPYFLAPESPKTWSEHTITPKFKQNVKPDLTSVGYTSIFINVTPSPKNPKTRLPFEPPSPTPPNPISIPLGLKRLSSLSALKRTRHSRSKSENMPPSHSRSKQTIPTLAPPMPGTKYSSPHAESSGAVSKSKKSKYAHLRPPMLASEVALAQLADGGTVDEHIKRFQDVHAKCSGAVKVNGQLVGVGNVWRDEEGGLWRDQDEEWEFAHLLGGDEDHCMNEIDWVQFKNRRIDEERRGSLSSQESHDSDLDPRYAMDTEADPRDDLAPFGGSLAVRRPGLSIIALPSQSRRTAKHLRKPEFLLDTFPTPVSSPTTAMYGQREARVPLAPRRDSVGNAPRGSGSPASTIRAAAPSPDCTRRRPAPLSLMPLGPTHKYPTNPLDPAEVRKDFLEASFAPRPIPQALASAPAKPRPIVTPIVPLKGGDVSGKVTKNAPPKPNALSVNMKGILKRWSEKL